MWPFLILLSVVPMLYYWSDAVVEVFPVLAKYFPGHAAATQVLTENPLDAQGTGTRAAVQAWAQVKSEAGYLIWLLSADGQYRLAVGCRTGTPATIQVTQLSGVALPDKLILNFRSGEVALTAGNYAGSGLINAVSQLGYIAVQLPQTVPPNPVLTTFRVDLHDSGIAARNLQQHCLAQ